MKPTTRVSWADIHSDDSNSFQVPPPAATARRLSAPAPAPPAARRPRVLRVQRSLPIAEDSYAGPVADVHENSRAGINAALKNFGVLLPKEGVVLVEDSNTAGSLLMKRSMPTESNTPEPTTKRVRGPTSFPLDPVFGGPMPLRASPALKKKFPASPAGAN